MLNGMENRSLSMQKKQGENFMLQKFSCGFIACINDRDKRCKIFFSMQDVCILCLGAAFETLSRTCSNTKEYFAEITSPV